VSAAAAALREEMASLAASVSAVDEKTAEMIGSRVQPLEAARAAASESAEAVAGEVSALSEKLASMSSGLEARLSELSEQQSGGEKASAERIESLVQMSSDTATKLTEMATSVAARQEAEVSMVARASEIETGVSALGVRLSELSEAQSTSTKAAEDLVASRVEAVSSSSAEAVSAAAAALRGEMASSAKIAEDRWNVSSSALQAHIALSGGRTDASDERILELSTLLTGFETRFGEQLIELSTSSEMKNTTLMAKVIKATTEVQSVKSELTGSIADLRVQMKEAIESEEITEAMENWLDQRMGAVDQSRLEGLQNLEEQNAEVEATLGLLQRKIGSLEGGVKLTQEQITGVQNELSEMATSTETKNTMLMARVVKATTAGVSKAALAETNTALGDCTNRIHEQVSLLASVQEAVTALETHAAEEGARLAKQMAESEVKVEGLINGNIAAKIDELAEDVGNFQMEFAQLKVGC
jgi:hypothetical protein